VVENGICEPSTARLFSLEGGGGGIRENVLFEKPPPEPREFLEKMLETKRAMKNGTLVV